MSEPTKRTLKALREQGYYVEMVEGWKKNPNMRGGGYRKDLLGFIDIIALREGEIVGVQSTGGGFSAHRHKILGECRTRAWAWLDAGGRIELWGWTKKKLKRGGIAMRWKPRVEEITGETLIEYAKEHDGKA